MKKILLSLTALLLIGVGCATKPATPTSQTPEQAQPATAPAPKTAPSVNKAPVTVPNLGGISPENSEDRVVVFDGEKFVPASVAVHVGHTITWKNASTQDVWPQADSNPNGTAAREFDPREPIHPGQEWDYTFNRAGTFPYHNYFKNGASGLVTVTPVGK